MGRRKKPLLPVRVAFALSVIVHAIIAFLLLAPAAPSAPRGKPVAIAVVFAGAAVGETGAPDGGAAGDAGTGTAATADAPDTVAPAGVDAAAETKVVASVPPAPPVDATPPPAADPAPVAEAVPEAEPEANAVPAAEESPAKPPVAAAALPAVEPALPERAPEPVATLAANPRQKPVPPAPVTEPATVMPPAGPELRDADATPATAPGPAASAPADPADPATRGGSGRTGGPMRAGDRPGGGRPGLPDDYLARLEALLEQAMRYPRRARLRNEEGVVLVRFVIHHDGAVSGVDIARSSGHALLDAEAVDLLQRVQPLPRSWRSAGLAPPLRLEVPVRFVLH